MRRFRAKRTPEGVPTTPTRTPSELPRRTPCEPARPRALRPEARESLFDLLDEQSATFWASYYAALAHGGGTITGGSSGLSSVAGALLPGPDDGHQDRQVDADTVDADTRLSLFALRRSVTSVLPPCAQCGGDVEVSVLDVDMERMELMCRACGLRSFRSFHGGSEPGDAGVSGTERTGGHPLRD